MEDFSDLCEVKGCDRPATKITTSESKYIMVCSECYHNKYKS